MANGNGQVIANLQRAMINKTVNSNDTRLRPD